MKLKFFTTKARIEYLNFFTSSKKYIIFKIFYLHVFEMKEILNNKIYKYLSYLCYV